MKNILLTVLFLCVIGFTMGQTITWTGEAVITGIISSEESNPFWVNRNSNTQFGDQSTFSGLATLQADYQFSEKVSLNAGATALYRDGVENQLQRRDLFLEFENSWLRATLGANRGVIQAQGLSATNKNFLFSNNARPLPGILLQSSTPFKLSNTFSIDWGIAHYKLNDDRYVDDVNVHFKRLAVHIRFNESQVLTAKITHYAQWGGTSPVYGEFPNDFSAFTKVFLASKGSETSNPDELANAIGNHLGSYMLDYQFTLHPGKFSIYHEHPFEDGSGSRGINVPDGVYGIHFRPNNKNIFNGLLYEFITTADQSGIDGGRGFDDYFGNNLYRGGWLYEGNVIGLPFVLVDHTRVIDENNSPILSNSASVHHLGALGSYRQMEWLVKSSYATHNGTLRIPFDQKLKIWSNYASFAYKTNNLGTFRLFGAIDSGKLITNTAAVGLEYGYSF